MTRSGRWNVSQPAAHAWLPKQAGHRHPVRDPGPIGACRHRRPKHVDGLVWWGVRFTSSQGNTFSGWVAGAKASGAPLLAPLPSSQPPQPKPPAPPPKPPHHAAQAADPAAAQATRRRQAAGPPQPKPRPFAVGDKATAVEAMDLLRSPAANPNSATDVIYRVPANAELTLVEGPEQAEGRTWWRVRYVSKYGNPFIGWAPVTSASGGDLLRASWPAAGTHSARTRTKAATHSRPNPNRYLSRSRQRRF